MQYLAGLTICADTRGGGLKWAKNVEKMFEEELGNSKNIWGKVFVR